MLTCRSGNVASAVGRNSCDFGRLQVNSCSFVKKYTAEATEPSLLNTEPPHLYSGLLVFGNRGIDLVRPPENSSLEVLYLLEPRFSQEIYRLAAAHAAFAICDDVVGAV